MTDPSIPTSPNRGHIKAVTDPGALQTWFSDGFMRWFKRQVRRNTSAQILEPIFKLVFFYIHVMFNIDERWTRFVVKQYVAKQYVELL